MWVKLKRWWRGADHLQVYLTGGQIIDLYVKEWKVTTEQNGRVAKYSFVFHPRNFNNLQTLAIEDISAIVLKR